MQKFYIIAVADKDKVNFQEVAQNPNTLVYSLDGTKCVIKQKVNEDEPSFITSGLVTPLFTFNSNKLLLESSEYQNNWQASEEI